MRFYSVLGCVDRFRHGKGQGKGHRKLFNGTSVVLLSSKIESVNVRIYDVLYSAGKIPLGVIW